MLDKRWCPPPKIAKFQAAKIKYLTLDTDQIELEIFDLAKQSKTFVLPLFCRRKIVKKNFYLFKMKTGIFYVYSIKPNPHFPYTCITLWFYKHLEGKKSKLIVTFQNGTIGILVCLCTFIHINKYCISSFEIF